MNEVKLSERAVEERRKYKREWSAKNADRVREYNRRYWERKAQEGKRVDGCAE